MQKYMMQDFPELATLFLIPAQMKIILMCTKTMLLGLNTAMNS